ncbi:MAG: hypothetical protein M3R61_00020 [Chloroflexota bacterium]|nr:hypothetical protein [Chloroflexota bacterium]
MPPKHPRQRIEIDTLFAPSPQDLVLDRNVSASACRLWDVLYVFRWQGLPPDFDALAAALATTERSIYRWLQELETTGWIDWDRHASLADRFTLRTSPHGKRIDTGVNSFDSELTPRSKELTPRSKELIPRSKELIVGSEELTQVSISSLFDPVLVPQKSTLPSDQNHEKTQKNQKVGVGVGALTAAMLDRGLNETSVERIVRSDLDPETLIQSLDNMLADALARGQDPEKARGRFVTRLRLSPPEKGTPYGRQFPEPGSAGNGSHGTGRRDRRENRERSPARANTARPGDLAYYDRPGAGADRSADGE